VRDASGAFLCGKHTENMRKIEENEWKIIPFLSFSFLNLLPDDPFSRSFPVVFGRFCGHFWRKSENFGEKWRISGNLVEFSRKSFLFIPFLSSIPRFYALQHVFETILSEE
jgi:hypothetical protein